MSQFLPDDFWYGTELYKAQALVIECCIKLKLDEYYNRLSIEWSNGLKTAMGNARPVIRNGQTFGEIRLSTHIWPRASETERRETIVHEAAHILAYIVYGERCGHGAKWRSVMSRLGYPNADRCHQVDTKGLQHSKRRYIVMCRGCNQTLHFTTAKRTQSILRTHRFRCRDCRTTTPWEDIINAPMRQV